MHVTTPTTTKRRSLVAAIIVVAVAAAVLIGAAGPSGSTAADAPTTTTTVAPTTTTPEVGPIGDAVDLDRLEAHADAIEAARHERLKRFYEGLAKKKAEEEEKRKRREAAAKKLAEPAPASSPSPAPAPEPSAPPPTPTPAPGGGPADRIAAAHGLRVVYGDPTPCGTSGSATYVAGCFLSSTPNVIYMSSSALDPGLAGVADAVARHESAHALIARACSSGSAKPPITGGRHEQVADAYAHLFLGSGPSSGGYGYTASDAAIARSIRAGDCGRAAPPPLPAVGSVSAHIGSHPAARQTVMSPRPTGEVGACRTVSAPAGWGATCDGVRVIVTAPAAGATPGSTAAISVQTDRGWSYRIAMAVR